MATLLSVAMFGLSGNKAGAVFIPGDCAANNLALNIGLAPGQNGFVTNGQTVTFVVSLLNPYQSFSGKSCNAFDMDVTFNCPDASGGCSTTAIILTNNAALNPPPLATDLPAEVLIGFVQCTIPLVTTTNTLKGCTDITEGFSNNGPTANGIFTRHSEQPLVVRTPQICVSKTCDSAVLNAAGQVVISFSGTVTNCGDEVLNTVTVVNDQPAPGTPVFSVSSLAVGAGAAFSGTYTNQGSVCGPFPDTVTATAIGADTSSTVTDTASAQCTITYTPCIDVTKTCPPSVTFGTTSYQVSGIVTNCGNILLTNVVVVDNGGTPSVPGDDTTVTIGNLAVGASAPWTATIAVPAGFCGRITNTVSATGNNLCTGAVVGPDTATCITAIECPPDICVTKGVVCAPSSGADCDPSLAYAPSATGVAGPTNQASFCYEIVVWNCGSDVLTNVSVVDNKISVVAGDFPTILAVNQRATNYYQLSFDPNTSTTNVVTATGTGQASGITTNKVAQAIANVLPVGVLCDITLSSAGAVEGGNCEVDLDSNNGTDQSVTFTLVVTNTGLVDLDVALSGVPALVDCADPTNAVTVPASVPISVGGTFTLTGCVLVSCPGADFKVTVQGTAIAGTNGICIYDAEGKAVTTAPSSCVAQVCCVSPVTCRTTGGGVLIPGVTDTSFTNCGGLPRETTLFPATNCIGQAVVKVTHGGQLGAPYAQQDCGEVLGNPCIRGQWQHVRHYDGPGNPRDSVTSIHTVTPKGQFDSLSCACLPCCDDGVLVPVTTEPGKKFTLCNPDDHKICGPMPRQAPANALIWSGLGQLTGSCDTAKTPATWVVLRVYIEDRSEPGGQHPGGASAPADIYCYQMWYTGIPVTKKPDYNGVATALRTAVAQDSCNFLDSLSGGALPLGSLPSDTVNGIPADVIDCGPLQNGNRQIHPSTSATCTP